MMKQALHFAIISLLSMPMPANAQTTFETIDSVDINNITAAVLVHGDLWWQPQDYANRCRYPAHASTNVNYVSAIWMSGYDAGNNLHMTAQTYRQNGNDWWPGPLDAADTLSWATSQSWARIWKVNRTDIQTFQLQSPHTIFNTPEVILTWPGKGNTSATGNAGATLIVNENMAPFVDVNSNGIYEPLLGDYPDVPGDQALWWVYSDNGPTHNESKGRPLGVEVHAMAYAYNRGTAIDNVIYYDYTFNNKSSHDYHNCRIGQWDDVDLGYWLDDYVGFDSAWRMAVAYNGVADDGGHAGHPHESYGTAVPQSGLTMVVSPGDAGTSYVPAGSFMVYNNNLSVIGNPLTDTEQNNYMRARLRNGKPIDSLVTGSGPCGVTNPNYFLPGDPSDPARWSECKCNNAIGDRRFVLSSADFSLNAGTSAHAVFALVVADTGKTCFTNADFNAIGIMADTAWHIYHNPLPPRVGTADIQTGAQHLAVYPSPARNELYIQAPAGHAGAATTIQVYNTLGQALPAPVSSNGAKYTLTINSLPPGLYSIVYRYGTWQATARFMKD